MPLSAFGTVLYSISNSMSPYSLSVVRYAPFPSLTSSLFSTVQCFAASAVQASRFAVFSSADSFANSCGPNPFSWMAQPYQPVRSLPLKIGVNPCFVSAATASGGREPTVEVQRTATTKPAKVEYLGIMDGHRGEGICFKGGPAPIII